ncbi:hypothetical protein D9M71_329640 [compost metagenome]
MFSLSQRRSSGRPFISTMTIGLPVAFSALSISTWLAGMRRLVLLDASWAMPWDSPTTATTTSACFAASTASTSMACGLRGPTMTSGLYSFR